MKKGVAIVLILIIGFAIGCKPAEDRTWVTNVELLSHSFYYDTLTATSESQPGLVLQAKVTNTSNDTIRFNDLARTNSKVYAYLFIANDVGATDTILLDKLHPRTDWAPCVTREVHYFETHSGFIDRAGIGWAHNDSTAYYKVLHNWLQDTIDVELHVLDRVYRTSVREVNNSTTLSAIPHQ